MAKAEATQVRRLVEQVETGVRLELTLEEAQTADPVSARVERAQTTTWTLHLSNEEFHQLHAVIGQVRGGVLDDLYYAIDDLYYAIDREIDPPLLYRGVGSVTVHPREVE